MTTEPFPPPVPSADAIRAWLTHRVDRCARSPGMIAGITENGQHSIVAYGVADQTGRPVDETTLFEIGSITKLFTALLLADMIHRGEAARDEPVADLLPPGTRVPDRNGQPITLSHLAAHRSGLPRILHDIGSSSLDPYADYTPERLYAFLADYKLPRTPGEGFEYSNLGAGLLGHALGLRAGQDYKDLVATRIVQPLGLSSTAFDLSPQLTARFASGQDASGDAVPAWDFAVVAGAGGLRSTVPDLLVFLEALMDQTGPLAPAAAMLTTPSDQGGLGFALSQPEGHVALQHDGGTGGFRSYAGCIPAWRRGAVVFANAASGACTDLGIHLIDPRWALHWFREPAPVDPACFDRLLGRYRMHPAFLFDVTRSGDRLIVQVTDQPAIRVFPLSEWRFFYKTFGAQITFEPGPDGRAARLILHQNNQDQTADRVEP